MLDKNDLQAIAALMDLKLEPIHTDIQELKSDVAGLKTDVAGLKTDVAGLKTDVAGLKTDVAGLKTDVAGLKTDVAGLKTDVAGLKTDVSNLKSDMAEVKDELRRVATVQENTVLPRLQLLYENQVEIIAERRARDKLEHRIVVLEDDIFAVKEVIREQKLAK